MKKNSTRILTATLAVVMVAAMTACGSSNSTSSSSSTPPPAPSASATPAPTPESTPDATPEDLAKKYEEAINAARDEETNGYYPVTSNANKDATVTGYIASAKENGTELSQEDAEKQYTQQLEMLAQMMGLKLEDMQAYAISTSLMNVKAYAVALVKPAEGKEADVEAALKGYVTAQQKAFENYLADQKSIADAAVVKTLDDGTILLVMSEKQDEISEAITTNLNK